MRAEHVLLTLTGLLLGCLMTFVGVLLFLTDYIPKLTHFIAGINLSLAGLAMILFGVFFLTIYAFLSRRRYVCIEMGDVHVHQEMFREVVNARLIDLFPSQKIDCEVMIRKKGRIEIMANIPFSPEEEHLQKIEADLAAGLATCGYRRPFVLNVQIS